MSSISVRFNSILSFIRFSMNTIAIPLTGKLLVGLDGLEPSTSRLSGVRSNHLSYRPSTLMASFVPSLSALADAPLLGTGSLRLVEMMGFEPMTPCLQGRCSPS